MRAPLAILDRDGVLNELVLDPVDGRHEGPLSAEDVTLAPGALEGCLLFRAAGWRLAVASNQPAAAKGKITVGQQTDVHERVVALLVDGGVHIDAWHYCRHHPEAVVPELRGPCRCRKPRPGLLVDIMGDLGAAPGMTWMVGDADSDIAAARSAGCHAALVEHPRSTHRRTVGPGADVFAPDLAAAAAAILRSVG